MREFSTAVTAIGAVKPQIGAEVRVGARISGKLMRLPANIGDRVERGQVIAELENADLAATVARQEAAVASRARKDRRRRSPPETVRGHPSASARADEGQRHQPATRR